MQNKFLKQFAEDVHFGLSQDQKSLPSKYFYDEKGDELFVQIMGLPEYYLSRAEIEIFSQKSVDIIEALRLNKLDYFELIELGAGDGSKTHHLLKQLMEQGYQFDFIPVDISKNSLQVLEQNLSVELPELNIKSKHGDYFKILESLKESHHPKVVLFLGSNIGNMNDQTAREFILKLGNNLNKHDKLVVGLDLIKSVEIVKPAYDDEQGVTREFNLNLLQRINNELGGDFNLSSFNHLCEYTEREGIAKSYLVSLCHQHVQIRASGTRYQLRRGERIHTEISRKYNDNIINHILNDTGFEIIDTISDSQNYFSDYILNRQ